MAKVGNLYRYVSKEKRTNYLIFSPELMHGVFTIEKTPQVWSFLPHMEEEVFLYLGKHLATDNFRFWALKSRVKVYNSYGSACHQILFDQVLEEINDTE